MVKKIAKRNQEQSRKKTSRYPGEGTDNKTPVWVFDKIDKDGKFAFNIGRSDFAHREFLDKLISYTNLTWSEIKRQTHDRGKSKHHFLDVELLCKEAQDRIKIRHLEEYSDNIFSFALQNKLRIIGIRENEFFHVLWYDPNHEVCPSHLKNT